MRKLSEQAKENIRRGILEFYRNCHKQKAEKLKEILKKEKKIKFGEAVKLLKVNYDTLHTICKYHNLKVIKQPLYPEPKIKELTEIQKAYIAGIIDGEGSITITPFSAFVFITNTDLNMLQTIRSWVGFGKIVEKDKAKKTCYRLIFYSKEAKVLLREIKNFLIIKRDLAEKAYEKLVNFKGVYRYFIIDESK